MGNADYHGADNLLGVHHGKNHDRAEIVSVESRQDFRQQRIFRHVFDEQWPTGDHDLTDFGIVFQVDAKRRPQNIRRGGHDIATLFLLANQGDGTTIHIIQVAGNLANDLLERHRGIRR